ncbi:YtcA family lipoprotein [Klebsiella oxytoca]|uniref:YtcA family lipoprotein n=1 Tax=Klebsiella oxytoca TaxID=571 RepID=UPI0020C59A19|nr:YtcA family lipoprotein [Klebsiella oxytoca]
MNARLFSGRPLAALAILMLSGCVTKQAPAFIVLGSYFPAWIACALVGIIVAAMTRIVFIRIGIDDFLPVRLLVYTCLALVVAFLSSLLIFAR